MIYMFLCLFSLFKLVPTLFMYDNSVVCTQFISKYLFPASEVNYKSVEYKKFDNQEVPMWRQVPLGVFFFC
jgi:hypothetical protein